MKGGADEGSADEGVMPNSMRARLYMSYIGLFIGLVCAALLAQWLEGWPLGPGELVALALLLACALGALLLVRRAFERLAAGVEQLDEALRRFHAGQPTQLRPADLPPELQPLARSLSAMGAQAQEQQRELHDQLRRTALLTRLSIELRESLDPATIVREILGVLLSNTRADTAGVILVGPDGSVALAMAQTAGGPARPVPPDKARRVLERGLAGWVLRNGASVLLSDIAHDTRWLSFSDSRPAGSAVALPLSHSRVTLGVLTITHAERAQFSGKDLLLLESVAAQVGVALSAALRHTEERIQREQALLLFSMSQFLTSERSTADLTQELLEKSRAVFEARRIELFLCGGGALQPAPGGRPAGSADADLEPLIAAAAADACRTREVVIRMLPGRAERAPGSCIALPLQHSGSAIGAFVLVPPSSGPPSLPARVWSMLTIFTNVAAAAFANLQLVAQLHTRAEHLEEVVGERTRQLQHSRDLLRVVFDHLPDALLLLDAQGRVLAANDAFCRRVLGQSPQEAVGHTYQTLLERLRADGRLCFEEQGPGESARRAVCAGAAGQQRWFEIDHYHIPNAEPPQTIERWRDITRQEQLHRQLLLHEQLASLGRLAASVVHEVGNPLQGVRSCLDLCREDPDLPPAALEYLDLADRELERINQLLDRWRDLYRPAQLVWQPVDLNRLAELIQQISRRELTKRRIEMRCDLEPRLPAVRGQPDALRQVLLNLLLNAQEAMPEGGLLRLATRSEPRRRANLLEVCDSGRGISPERLERLFEPDQSRPAQQLGLGLYLSREIVRKHGGEIRVTSAVGQGTTVLISLPWSEALDGEHDAAAGG